jgi:hypothetical protein
VLRDDALVPQPAGVLEDRLTVPGDVLVELDARGGDLPQEVLEPAPALPHPVAVVLDLVDPVGSDRRLIDPGRDARFDEAERVPLE